MRPVARLAPGRELEAADLAPDPGREGGDVEGLDFRRARLPGEERRPEALDVHADRRDDAEAGDHRPLDAPSCWASR